MVDTVIIADDLTGACDTCVKLVAQGYDAQVILDASRLPADTADDGAVYAVNTNTRSVDGKSAYHLVRNVAAEINGKKSRPLYKKIDSVLRGNVGVEIDAVLDATGLPLAVIAPSLPQNGRVVKGGKLYVNALNGQSPGQSVEAALYGSEATPKCRQVFISELRKGSEHIARVFEELVRNGWRHCIVDAETKDDLSLIADAIRESTVDVLPVGSAGLAEQLFRNETGNRTPNEELQAADSQKNMCVAVITSKHPSTVAQLQRLRGRHDTAIFTYHTAQLGYLQPIAVAGKLADDILTYVSSHRQIRLIVITTHSNMEVQEEAPSLPDEDVSDCGIATVATTAAAAVTRALPVTSVIASGGDTANYYLSNFKLEQIKLLAEPIPGTVAARMDAWGEPSRLLVTKSGGFGDEETLNKLADFALSHVVAEKPRKS